MIGCKWMYYLYYFDVLLYEYVYNCHTCGLMAILRVNLG